MNNIGIVTKCEKEFAFIKIKRDSMCGDNCGNCNLCANKNIEIKGINTANAKAGDKVEVKMPEKTGLSAAILAYGAPMFILVLGIALGAVFGEVNIAAVISVGVIILWYAILMVLEKNKRYSQKLIPVIIRIIEEVE